VADLIRLGKAIAERRRREGMTQAQLGKAIGITLNSVSRIETGKAELSQGRLGNIAAALGTTAHELLAQAVSVEDTHRESLRVAEAARLAGYPDAALTLSSKVLAHAHRLLAQLADDGADEHSLDQAKKLFLEPERYTYSAHGRIVMLDEDDIIRDMNALAEVARNWVHDRKRLAEDLERAAG
jgi:transcriptional regulator with XRE-family HTH domain